jgi:thiol-disulfide isomerase/thioredoxin
MMRTSYVNFLICAIGICLSLVGFVPVLEAKDPEKLPWEESLAAAREKAIQEKRPLFIMMTATWCGPCKMLESKTLPSEMVQEGLEDFVWVQAFEDKEVEAKYGCRGYPTLAFVDPSNDKVLFITTGYQAVGPFLKQVIAARQAASLELNERLEQLAAKSFTPDFQVLKELIANGDAVGLKKYLAPVEEDMIRESNYLVGKIVIPEDVGMNQIIAPGLIRGALPDSGLFVTPIPRESKEIPTGIIARGCKSITTPLRLPNDKAVVFQKFELDELTPKDAIKFIGTVTLPDGKPASNAIVRICDWDETRTDGDGKFQFDRVSPGEFLVRACSGSC